MARGTASATGRSRITSPSKEIIEDNGTLLCSIVQGEQIQLQFTASWLTNMTGVTTTAKIVEGNNDGAGTKPTSIANTPVITSLPIIDSDITDNVFRVVIPSTLIDSWAVEPEPNKPVYGFMDIEIADSGVGNEQQIWKPVRGLVEVLYSPTEEV